MRSTTHVIFLAIILGILHICLPEVAKPVINGNYIYWVGLLAGIIGLAGQVGILMLEIQQDLRDAEELDLTQTKYESR